MGERVRIRYAVVGLGHIAQVAVLPSFTHARQNSEVTALVSDDPAKHEKLRNKYKVQHTYSYEEYDKCLSSGAIDAVYIALPNNLHCEFAVRAAQAGVHVLCEKPMAVTEDECDSMISAAEKARVKLMVAYRLHFEKANLEAVEIAHSGKLGEPRFFSSLFAMQVKDDNIRLKRELGGGTLYDIGVYCVNAARSLFRAEPSEVHAFSMSGKDRRFREVDEMTGALLRFPDERLASFTCSFGAADVSSYELVGTEGHLRVEPAYEYVGELRHHLTVKGKPRERTFSSRDQFAPELIYFSNCIINNLDPEPSGAEGLADVRVVRALYRSAESGRPVQLEPYIKRQRPGLEQEMARPPVDKPELIHVESASQ